MHLTQAAVEKLKPPTDKPQEYYFDEVFTRLVLCVGARRKTWYAVHYVNSKTRYFKLGNFPGLDLKEARARAMAFVAEPQKFLKDKVTAVTFAEVADSFLRRHVEAKGLRSKGEIGRIITKYCARWNDRPFVELRRSDVTALLDRIEDHHGARQADMVLAVVRKMMNWHMTRTDDYVSPLARGMARVSGADRARDRILTDDELRDLWTACGTLGAFGALLKCCLLTAQRKDKVTTMQWGDLADGVWVIRRDKREKGNAGCLRLPPQALAIIGAQPRLGDNDHVFAASRGAGPFNSFSDWKARLEAKLPADMPHWQIHDLRRTARSLLSRAGVQPHISERVMGHAIIGVEAVYDRHSYDTEKAEALQKLADLIERIVSPVTNVDPNSSPSGVGDVRSFQDVQGELVLAK